MKTRHLHRRNPCLWVGSQVFLCVLLLLAISGCRREDPYENFITTELPIAQLDTLQLDGVYEVILVQDTINKVILFATERVSNKTKFTTNGGELVVDTKGNGKFLRPREPVARLYVHVRSLKLIKVYETCSIRTQGTLTGTEIGLINKARVMEADLELNCGTFYYWNNPVAGNLLLHGQANELKIWNAGLARVQAKDLLVDNVLAENGSQATCEVNPRLRLEYSITSIGNIIYYGTPAIVPKTITGTGQLVRGN